MGISIEKDKKEKRYFLAIKIKKLGVDFHYYFPFVTISYNEDNTEQLKIKYDYLKTYYFAIVGASFVVAASDGPKSVLLILFLMFTFTAYYLRKAKLTLLDKLKD